MDYLIMVIPFSPMGLQSMAIVGKALKSKVIKINLNMFWRKGY